ncbi:MAG: alpha/beta fold hydrolase [Anaerolineae bacterium]|nr:alpha/beta fold hydrolase [Anaerolineae bacterium]
MRLRIWLLIGLMLAWTSAVYAQRDTDAEIVTAEAHDGLTLVGEFYASTNEPAPAVLLLHMLGSRRSAWQPLIPWLSDAGYNVLAVDLRGHGETQGAQDWPAAERDVETWLDWLGEQPSVMPDRIAIVGASIGANLALNGCAFDERCITTVALSPGLDYRGVVTEPAVSDGLAERSALLVASQRDAYSADSVKMLTTEASGELGLQLYPGSAHGTALLGAADAPVIPLILNWLAAHLAIDNTN